MCLSTVSGRGPDAVISIDMSGGAAAAAVELLGQYKVCHDCVRLDVRESGSGASDVKN